MGLLSRLLGFTTGEEASGVSLGEEQTWRVTGVTDAKKFFTALGRLIPTGAVLALHDPQGKEVRSFLQARPARDRTKVAAGTIWPRTHIYHIACTAQHLAQLAELATRHAEPEMAIHLHVYQVKSVTLEWYDAFDEPLYVSRTVNEDVVASFSNDCGGSFRSDET